MDTKVLKRRTRDDLVHKELCYQIVGIPFEVFKELGHGHAERVYQRVIAIALENHGLTFIEQLYVPVIFKGKTVGRNYLDFLINGLVVLEIKKGDYFLPADIQQVYQYLVAKKLQLGILAYFAPRGVHYKRFVNILS